MMADPSSGFGLPVGTPRLHPPATKRRPHDVLLGRICPSCRRRGALMANVERLKRRLMRDLVQENLDLRQGRLRPPAQRRRNGRSLRLAAALMVPLVSVALLGSAQLISNFAAD